jgi:hypothetical protein
LPASRSAASTVAVSAQHATRAPDPLALVVERHPALATAVDLDIGGIQLDRHLLTQRRRTVGGQQPDRGRSDVAEPGLHTSPIVARIVRT